MIYVWTNQKITHNGIQSFYCIREVGPTGNQKYERMHIQHDGKIEWESYDLTAEPKPFMVLPWGFSEEFLSRFMDMLDTANIKPEKVSKIEGLLQAKDEHLQDMRALVFHAPMPSNLNNKKEE